MYQILIGDVNGNNKIIYHPSNKEFSVFDTELSLSVGECGEFTFKVPEDNFYYDKVSEQKVVTILRDNEEYWRGYIKEISVDMRNNLDVYCVEDLGWLNYEFVTPSKQTKTRAQFLQDIINTYNTQTGVQGTEKAFVAGYVTSNISKTISTTYEDSLLDYLRLVAGEDNYVRVRRQDGKRYIDIVTINAYGKVSNQPIELRVNLTKYAKEINTGHMLNVIYPYGAEIKGENIYENQPKRLVGTPIEDTESIAKYGRIAKNVLFNTGDINILNAQADNYLRANRNPRVKLELSAVDISELGADVDSFELGDTVLVNADELGADGLRIPITSMKIDLQHIQNNSITLSSIVRNTSLTSQTAELTAELQKIPSESTILASAKRNTTQIINGNGTNGHVVLHENEEGVVYEILIMDKQSIDTASKMWRWNESGFGFREKDDNGIWKDYDLAMTMNGEIVADMITTGTMYADRIHGGTLKLGGYDNQNGVLEVYAIGGSNYQIEFDSNCNWENNFDGVTIFYENKGEYYSSPQKLRATQVTQGIVVPEAEKIYVYWYTDGSANNYYGLKVNRVVKTDNTPTLTFSKVDSLPMSETTSKIVNTGEYFNFETNHNPYPNNDRQLLGITVHDTDTGKLAARLDKNGLNVFSGDIKGSDITLGGYGNEQGAIDVRGSDNQSVGTWNKDGIKVFNKEKEWLKLSKGFLSGGGSNSEEIGKIGFVGKYNNLDHDIMTLYTKQKILLSSEGFILDRPSGTYDESLVGEGGFNALRGIDYSYDYINGTKVITDMRFRYVNVETFNGIICKITEWEE